MILNDVKIFYTEGKDVATATFTKEKYLNKVASYVYPSGTIDTVERTYFNAGHIKTYGQGYEDLGDFSLKIDLDTDNLEAVKAIETIKNTRTGLCIGLVVDDTQTDLNVKFAVVLSKVAILDGEQTPSGNGMAVIEGKINSRPVAFTEPTV